MRAPRPAAGWSDHRRVGNTNRDEDTLREDAVGRNLSLQTAPRDGALNPDLQRIQEVRFNSEALYRASNLRIQRRSHAEQAYRRDQYG